MKLGIKRRLAVSEVLATLIMIAVTLVAGVAAFGWINGQAASSEGAYGQSVANNVNFLNERFVVLTETFYVAGTGGACSGGSCTGASFWIYNTGQVGFTLQSLRITNLTDLSNNVPLNVLFYTASITPCSFASQNCGFVVYNKATVVCYGVTAWSTTQLQPGFYQKNPTTGATGAPLILPQERLSASPYQITMPTPGATNNCLTQMFLYDGKAYAFTFTGLYGSSFFTTATVYG